MLIERGSEVGGGDTRFDVGTVRARRARAGTARRRLRARDGRASGGSGSCGGSPTIRIRRPRSSISTSRTRAGRADGVRRALAAVERSSPSAISPPDRSACARPARVVRRPRAGVVRDRGVGADRAARRAARARGRRARRSPRRARGVDRRARARMCARREYPLEWRRGYASRHDATLRRRSRPRAGSRPTSERVQGLIESLHGEGLDQEAADQVGESRTSRDPPTRRRRRSTREGRRDPRTARKRPRRDRSRIATARRRQVRRRRGDRRPIVPERLEAHPTARTNVDTPTSVSVTLRLFAAAREAAGRGTTNTTDAAPTVGALLDAAGVRVRADLRGGARDQPGLGQRRRARRRPRAPRSPTATRWQCFPGQRRDSLTGSWPDRCIFRRDSGSGYHGTRPAPSRPGYATEPRARTLEELRAMHEECAQAELALSYYRRLAQARMEILEAERAAARGAAPSTTSSPICRGS